jgi:hypothetical protein
MAVAGGALGLIPAIEAASGQGTVGTFIVGSQPCFTRGGCPWLGTFRSPGGAIVEHVTYDGTLPAYAAGGSGVPAVEPGGSHIVYPPRSSTAWLSDLSIMVLAGAVVGLLLWLSPLGLGEHEPGGAVV